MARAVIRRHFRSRNLRRITFSFFFLLEKESKHQLTNVHSVGSGRVWNYLRDSAPSTFSLLFRSIKWSTLLLKTRKRFILWDGQLISSWSVTSSKKKAPRFFFLSDRFWGEKVGIVYLREITLRTRSDRRACLNFQTNAEKSTLYLTLFKGLFNCYFNSQYTETTWPWKICDNLRFVAMHANLVSDNFKWTFVAGAIEG